MIFGVIAGLFVIGLILFCIDLRILVIVIRDLWKIKQQDIH